MFCSPRRLPGAALFCPRLCKDFPQKIGRSENFLLGIERRETESDGSGFKRPGRFVRKRRAVQSCTHADTFYRKPRGKRLTVHLCCAQTERSALRLACKQPHTWNVCQ